MRSQDLTFFSPKGLPGTDTCFFSAHSDQNLHAKDGSGEWPIFQVGAAYGYHQDDASIALQCE